jgi:hypothetical protein
MPPLSQNCIITNLKRIGTVVIKKKLKMFKCEKSLYIMFGPALGGKTSTLRIIQFTNLVEAFLLYITMHVVFLTNM